MIKDYSLTLTGAVQRLSDVFGAAPNIAPARDDIPVLSVALQPGAANSGAVYVGSTPATLSSAAYGVRLPAAVAGIPSAPFQLEPAGQGGPMKISDFYVLGTANDTLHLLVVGF